MKDFSGYGIWIFLGVIIALLLTAIFVTPADAGIFSPRIWTVEEVRETYNTPPKLGEFIRRQFVSMRYIGMRLPEEVLEAKGGNCKSIANFVKVILEPRYPCKIDADIRDTGYGRSHCVCAVKDGDKVWVFSGTDYKRKVLK